MIPLKVILKTTMFKYTKKFHLCTKIKPDNKWTFRLLQAKIENHINKLNQGKIETILFYDTKILYRKNGKQIFNNLEILKKYFKK